MIFVLSGCICRPCFPMVFIRSDVILESCGRVDAKSMMSPVLFSFPFFQSLTNCTLQGSVEQKREKSGSPCSVPLDNPSYLLSA